MADLSNGDSVAILETAARLNDKYDKLNDKIGVAARRARNEAIAVLMGLGIIASIVSSVGGVLGYLGLRDYIAGQFQQHIGKWIEEANIGVKQIQTDSSEAAAIVASLRSAKQPTWSLACGNSICLAINWDGDIYTADPNVGQWRNSGLNIMKKFADFKPPFSMGCSQDHERCWIIDGKGHAAGGDPPSLRSPNTVSWNRWEGLPGH